MTQKKDYDDIPGTYVYDSDRGRLGYSLNMFCMSLNKAHNRQAFKENPAAYLDRYTLTPEQRRTVLERDWLGMLKAGGNIYYTIKIAFCDGLTFQDVAGMMSGVSRETYAQMMLAGGRSPEGNRYTDAARAEAAPHIEGAPHVERMPHIEAAPHIEGAPHVERMPHIEAAPHIEGTPHTTERPPNG